MAVSVSKYTGPLFISIALIEYLSFKYRLSGEDVANITRSTGIPSSMIYSAVNAQKEKNVQTSVIQSTNDAGVVTVSVVNTKTGAIVGQTSLGAIGNVQQGAKASESEIKATYQLPSFLISSLIYPRPVFKPCRMVS